MQIEAALLELPRYRAYRFAVISYDIQYYGPEIPFWMEHLLTDMVTDMVIYRFLNAVFLVKDLIQG